MTSINKAILENLAATQKDEFADLIPNLAANSDLADAILAIQHEEKQAAIKAAAVEIQKLVKASTQAIQTSVENIRRIRRQEVAEQQLLKFINIAQAYGYATMNFLPLLSVLNGDSHHTVPEDWKAPVKTPAAKINAGDRGPKK